MILAYVTICLLKLHTCAPETAVTASPFDTEKECWEHVDEFMREFTAMGSGVSLTWKCGEDT